MTARLANNYRGRAALVATRLVPEDLELLDRIRETKELSRAEFIRYAIKTALDAEEATTRASKASQAA